MTIFYVYGLPTKWTTLRGSAFNKSHTHQPGTSLCFGVVETCPPVVTAATKLGDGDSLEMILILFVKSSFDHCPELDK